MSHSERRRLMMVHSSHLRVGLRGASLAMSILGDDCCSSLPPNLAADGTIRVDLQTSRSAEI